MLNIRPLASIEYLLEDTSAPRHSSDFRRQHREWLSQGNFGGYTNYYEAGSFKRPATWLGTLASRLGLEHFRTADFENVYYGYTPNKAHLHPSYIERETQREAKVKQARELEVRIEAFNAGTNDMATRPLTLEVARRLAPFLRRLDFEPPLISVAANLAAFNAYVHAHAKSIHRKMKVARVDLLVNGEHWRKASRPTRKRWPSSKPTRVITCLASEAFAWCLRTP